MYDCPNYLATRSLYVRLNVVNTYGPSMKQNGSLRESNPPVDTLSLSLFTSFTESYWEVDSPPVFSFDVVYQTVFINLRTLQLSMDYLDGFPKAAPSPTHYAVVVTPPTL